MIQKNYKKGNQVNQHIEEIKKFLKKKIVVEQFLPNGEIQKLEGVLRSVDFQRHSLILMTEKEKIFIPIYLRMTRKREPDKPVNKEKPVSEVKD